ncbi:MAG: nuclear transport factor 2 family protein [Acidobacteriota bacterium]
MIQVKVIILLIGLISNIGLAQGTKESNEKERVKQTIGIYFEGLKKCDAEIINRVVYSKAKWFSVVDGKVQEVTQEQKTKAVKTNPSQRYAKVEGRILEIDISGKNAFVKAEIDMAYGIVTEYLLLSSISGEWKIISGTASAKPKE